MNKQLDTRFLGSVAIFLLEIGCLLAAGLVNNWTDNQGSIFNGIYGYPLYAGAAVAFIVASVIFVKLLKAKQKTPANMGSLVIIVLTLVAPFVYVPIQLQRY